MATRVGPPMPTNEESPDLRLSDGQPLVTRLTETIFSAKATQLTEQTVVETSAEVIERISNPEHEKRSARGVFVSNQINQASVGANGNVVLAKVTSEVRVICPEDVFGSTSKAVRDEGHENWSIDETTVLALGPFQGRSSQHEPKEAQNDDVDDVDLDHVAQNHHLYSRSADGLQYHQAAINGNEDTSKLAISKPANESGLSDVLDGGTKRYQVYKSRDQINRTSKPENHDEVEKEDIPLEELLMEAEQGESPGEFVPLSELERIVNKKAVEARLVETFPNTDKRTISHMAEKVCLGSSKPTDQGQPQPVAAKSYRRVFAILAHLNKLAELPDFLDDAGGISDDELPLRRIKRKGARRLFDLRTKNNSSRICFNGWGAVEIKNFYLYQWVVLAPFFDPGEQKPISNYILHNETRLPFTSIGKLNDNDGSFHRGGFAKVYKVAIHPSHHAFDDPDNRGFAVKELEATDIVSFKQEVDIYASFAREPHDHISNLLATFQQNDKMCMIFPWADADLLKFWKEVDPPNQLDIHIVGWMVEQCAGLASALLRIHDYKGPKRQISGSKVSSFDEEGNPTTTAVVTVASNGNNLYGRHGDIKPQNILFFRDCRGRKLGTLKLSDFNVSEINTEDSKSNKHCAAKVAHTRTYRPPESAIHGEYVNQAFDIWTLGCLYLEFVAWILGGYQLVDSFVTQRQEPTDVEDIETTPGAFLDTFYSTYKVDGKTVARVKSAVTSVSDKNCSTYHFPPSTLSSDKFEVLKMSILTSHVQFIRTLRENRSCTLFLHDFLTVIKERMLVVDRKKRASCEAVVVKLEAMKSRCEADVNYAVKPASERPQYRTITAPSSTSCQNTQYELRFVRQKNGSRREGTTSRSRTGAESSSFQFRFGGVSRTAEK